MHHLQNKVFYNKGKQKATRLISRGKRDEEGSQVAFDQYNKPLREDSSYPEEGFAEPQCNNAENYNNRPFTAEGGPRQLFAGKQKKNRNSTRGISRKNKIKGIIMKLNTTKNQRKLATQHRNFKKGAFFRTERKSSLQNMRNHRKYTEKTPVYHADDVKDLKIVDYFNGLNRLNRYVKKTQERIRTDGREVFKSDNIGSKILSPFK